MTIQQQPNSSSLTELPLLYFPPFYTREILVMLFYDVTIVCSIILAGKPLCMCRQTANGHLHIHWHLCQLTIYTKSMKCHHFISKPRFCACDIYIYIYIYIYIDIYIYIYIYIRGERERAQCTYAYGKLTPPPPPIEHGSLENHYTKSVSYIYSTMHIYPWHIDLTPSQLSIDALNITTPNVADLPPIQLSIDALNTATPNMADIMAELPPSIDHRCIEYCYTKLGRSPPN